MDLIEWKDWIQERAIGMKSAERIQLGLLLEILQELRMMREATETEAVEDAEPDPFQTLNGPSQ